MDSENQNDGKENQDSFFNEFKEKMALDPLEDSVKHVKKKASRKQTITIAVLIGIAVVAGIGWNIYGAYKGRNSSVTEIPLLKADAEPEKVRPSEPGGMEVPDMDKLVYGRIGTGADGNEGYERILPAEEKPVSPAKEVASEPSDQIGTMIEEIETETVSETVVVDEPAPEVTSPEALSPIMPEPKAPVAITKEVTETETVTAIPGTDKAVIVKEKEVKITASVPPAAVSVPTPADGDFRVQILSGKDKNAVENAGKKLFAKYPEILKGYAYEVVTAEVPDKGTFYRLRIKSFATREAAQKVCKALKDKGQDCLVSSK